MLPEAVAHALETDASFLVNALDYIVVAPLFSGDTGDGERARELGWSRWGAIDGLGSTNVA